MHGEEWNDDDDNIKNSPCQINFFLFPLYHALLSLLYHICLLAYYILSNDLGLIFQSCLPSYGNFYLFTVHFYDICMSLRLMTCSNYNNHHALTQLPWANGFPPCLVALLFKLTTPAMRA
jgi:hypothetical protein